MLKVDPTEHCFSVNHCARVLMGGSPPPSLHLVKVSPKDFSQSGLCSVAWRGCPVWQRAAQRGMSVIWACFPVPHVRKMLLG